MGGGDFSRDIWIVITILARCRAPRISNLVAIGKNKHVTAHASLNSMLLDMYRRKLDRH